MVYLCRDSATLSQAREAVARLSCDKGQVWRVEVKRHRKMRSVAQNRLLRMYEGVVARETGQDADDVHEFVVASWCPRKTIETREIHVRTHRLNTKEMTTVIDSFRLWAAEILGITLPLPAEQGFEEMAAMADAAE
jgi:hypothetical protein